MKKYENLIQNIGDAIDSYCELNKENEQAIYDIIDMLVAKIDAIEDFYNIGG